MKRKDFTLILPVVIVGTLVLVVLAFIYSLDKSQSTNTANPQKVIPTSAISSQKAELLSLEDIKALMPELKWETTIKDTREVFFYDKPDVYNKNLSGISSFSLQKEVSINTYFENIDRELTKRGWQQATGADGPTGSIFGYLKEQSGKKRYVEFSYGNCESVGALCKDSKDGSIVFYSDEFE